MKVDSGITTDLHGVAANGTTDAWAVGDSGVILHWDGNDWSPKPSGTTVTLRAAWASAADDAWAAGDEGVILRWNGNDWSPVASGTEVVLRRLWGWSSADIWATGDSGWVSSVLLYWDGQAWSPLEISNATWISAPDDAWGGRCGTGSYRNPGGFYGFQTISHRTSDEWSDLRTFSASPDNPCTNPPPWFWGLAPGDVWAVFAGNLYHWDGTALTDLGQFGVQSLWGASAGDVWAVVQ